METIVFDGLLFECSVIEKFSEKKNKKYKNLVVHISKDYSISFYLTDEQSALIGLLNQRDENKDK